MANPLPEENEFYARIKNEQIAISSEIWDLLYNRIGDDISSINLLCQYYLSESQPIPLAEVKKILIYTRHIKDIVNKITFTSGEGPFLFPEILNGAPLHPILREMLTHYIGNDIYMINLIVGDALDPIQPTPLSLDGNRKILGYTRSIKEFMNRLREATLQNEGPAQIQAEPDNRPAEPTPEYKELSKEELFFKIRKLLASELKIKNEEKISLNSRFNEDLALDSIDAIQVIMRLEEEFNFEMPDDDVEKLLTVGQAVDYVFARLRKR